MTLHERLEAVFQTVFNDDELTLTDETTAQDIEGWDSVTNINLMFSIEGEFGLQFEGAALAEFKNIGEMKRYLEERV
jgi:acyl carrier protein